MSVHTSRRRRRLSWGAVLCLALTGCTGSFGGFGFACPAIGYISLVHIELVGNADEVIDVRLCDHDGNCSALATDPRPVEDAALDVIDPDQLGEQPVESSPEPTRVEVIYFATKENGASWSVNMPFGVPDDVVVTAYRADGSVAGETSSALEWKRVGGSAQCGGPMEAGPVEVDIR